MLYMTRNDMKKLTFEDKWYRLYTKGAGHRQHKSDKHCNHRKFRRLNTLLRKCMVLYGRNTLI